MFKVFFIALMLNASVALSANAQACMSMHVVQNTAAGYINQAGEIAGYHYDFLMALEERSGFCMEKILLPIARAKRNIKVGAHDGGILGRPKTPDPDIEYITKLITAKKVIIPRKGVVLNSAPTLANITIARIRKVNVDNVFGNTTNVSYVDVGDYTQGLKLMKRGRVDAIIGNALGINVIINKLNMAQAVDLSERLVIGQSEVWFVLSKKSKYIGNAEKLREATQALIDTGILDNILKRYFGENWQSVG